MFDLLNLKPGSFGLDISDLSLKLVQLKKINKNLVVSAIGSMALPTGIVSKGEVKDSEALALHIKKFIKKNKLNTRHVIACLPEEKAFIRVIEMPKMPRIQLKKAVFFEAENYIPFGLDKVYLDSEVICEKDGKLEVLVTAMPKKIVDAYVEAIKGAGLIPIALETESQAAVRALVEKGVNKEAVYLVDIGLTTTGFAVCCDECLRFASFIPMSSEEFTSKISKALKKDRAEAESLKKLYGLKNKGKIAKKIYAVLEPMVKELAVEIEKRIEYYDSHFEAKKAKELLLYGGGAELSGLVEKLSKNLSIKINKGDPLKNLSANSIEVFNRKKKKPLAYVVAIGLALREHD